MEKVFRKRVIFLVLLVIAILLLQTLLYKTAIWYDQAEGQFFIYVSVISIAVFFLSPLKVIKDKRKHISMSNYLQGFVTIIASISKCVFRFCKELVSTIVYMFAPKLFKEKTQDEDSSIKE